MLSNKTQTLLRKLSQKKYRKEMQAFVVEGRKGVEEALEYADVLMLVIDGAKREDESLATLIKIADKNDVLVEYAGHKDIVAMKHTETFPGVLAVVAMPDEQDEITDETVIILDKVNDPGNLGTIIRTADWFGVHTIILSEGSVDPYNEKVVRSTMGSIFRANIIQSHNIKSDIEYLKDSGYSIAALDLKGESIKKAKRGSKQVLIFGSESHGISKELCSLIDVSYTISGNGKAESLNIAMSVGITLFQVYS
jgi:RNA methyltransferase, TrmH family